MKNKVLELEHVRLTFRESDEIVEIHFKTPGEFADLRAAKEYYLEISNELNGNRAYLLISTVAGAQMTQEARNWVASSEYGEISSGDAIVSTNFTHEMAASFFIKYQNIKRPMRLFPSTKEATQWIEMLKKNSISD